MHRETVMATGLRRRLTAALRPGLSVSQSLLRMLPLVALSTALCSLPALAVDPFAPRRETPAGSENSPATESQPTAPRVLFAHPTVPVAPQPVTEAPVELTTVLVLDHGRIAEGRIHQTAAGYLVHRSGGRMLIPHDRVRYRARDRHHAWELQRSNGEDLSPARRVSLARWCLTYELYEEAQTELRAALEEEPSRRDARSMLVRLEGLLNPDAVQTRVPRREARRSSDGFEEPEIRSLSGLSRDSAKEFVTVIQPLLVNSCANASCHGSASESLFRLENVRVGQAGNRILTERNLAAVLDQINLSDPAVSPLLTVPRNGHGPGGRSVFNGSTGARLQGELQQWTSVVSAELTGRPVTTASSSRDYRGTRQSGGLHRKSGYNPFAGIPWNRGRASSGGSSGSRTGSGSAAAGYTARRPATRQPRLPQQAQSPAIPDASALAAFRSGGVRAAGMIMQAQAAQSLPRQHNGTSGPPGLPVPATPAVLPSGAVRPAASTDVVEQVLTEEQSDPFDPAAFNRRQPAAP